MYPSENQYVIDEDGIPKAITNFVLTVKKAKRVIAQNGAMTNVLTICGINNKNEILPEILVPANGFENGNWVNEQWGLKAAVFDKKTFKNNILKIIQDISTANETLCNFTGFFQYDGNTRFVDCNGCFTGQSHDPNFHSNLDGNMRFYKLPRPMYHRDYLKDSIKHCLELDGLSNNSYAPLFVLLPPMLTLLGMFTDIRFCILITDAYDEISDIGVLAQSFFGKEFCLRNSMVTDWTAEEKEIYECLSKLNGQLVVIDQHKMMYANDKNEAEADKIYEKLVKKVLTRNFQVRSQIKGTVLHKKLLDPLLVVICNRQLIPQDLPMAVIQNFVYFNMARVELNQDYLLTCRELAKTGAYAQVTSTFIQYLLKNFKRYKKMVEKSITIYEKMAEEAFEKANLSPHFRCAANLATMMTAMNLFYHLARKNEVITRKECKSLISQAWFDLLTLVLDQQNIIINARVGNDFIERIITAVRKGQAHFRDLKTGGKPSAKGQYVSFGWSDQNPQGEFLGWVDTKTGNFYICSKISAITIKAVIGHSYRYRSQELPDTDKAFWIMLKNAGALKSWDKGGNLKKIKMPPGWPKQFDYVRHLNLTLKEFRDQIFI